MKKIALLAMAIVLATLLAGCAKADKTPPLISEIGASGITISTATITWTTDEPATSQMEYGLTTSYGSTSPLDSSLVTSHSVTLNDLDENTTYHYQVKSSDESDNEAASADYNFTTNKIFPDENLEAAVREAIGKPEGPIYASDLEGLTSLDASERDIADLTGLEHCTSLTGLGLGWNEISDVSPLSGLASLTALGLSSNQISDLSPLSGLTNLIDLNLGGNQISDLSPLENLAGLTGLYLYQNQISDISPLSGLTSLTWLELTENQIGDVTPLSGLTSLIELDLSYNHISDLSPIQNLTSLTTLRLNDNQISNISPLQNLTSLTGLQLDSNEISDLTPLSNLTSLTWMYLGNNQISNVLPLSGLTSLTNLYIADNQISDITSLSGLTSLIELGLEDDEVSDISALSGLTSLRLLGLNNNHISDITPLVNNLGLGEGDEVRLGGNPLTNESVCTLIPQLEAKGVEVLYDEPLASIAYIYMSDTESANSYELFLEDNDYCVTLISMDNVATTDFSVYSLIVVGADTYTLQYDWGDADSVNAIDSSGKSIIGLGTGGACLFGELGLSISYEHAWNLTERSIYVVDPAHDIFTTPYFINVPEDRIIQLYEGGVYCHSLYEPDLSSEVVLLGREPNDMSHYPLAQEGQYIFWGFTASPESMTQVGKDLFLNVVDFMLGAS